MTQKWLMSLPVLLVLFINRHLRIYAIVIDPCFDAQDVHVKTTAVEIYRTEVIR